MKLSSIHTAPCRGKSCFIPTHQKAFVLQSRLRQSQGSLQLPSDSSSCRSRSNILVRHATSKEQDGIGEVAPLYSLKDTKVLVETSMLAAVSGLTYMMATLLRNETSMSYILPLPILLAAFRSGPQAGVKTMFSTTLLVIVLLGPMRAVSYLLLHGSLAAVLGALWVNQVPWALSIFISSLMRLAGQLGSIALSSVTLNENLMEVMVHSLTTIFDQLCDSWGQPAILPTAFILPAIVSTLFMNGLCYCFLLHVIYRLLLTNMGYKMGPMPGIVKKYLYAGLPDPPPS